jgi:hypothetical protein
VDLELLRSHQPEPRQHSNEWATIFTNDVKWASTLRSRYARVTAHFARRGAFGECTYRAALDRDSLSYFPSSFRTEAAELPTLSTAF